MSSTYESLRNRQIDWAKSMGVKINAVGYTLSLNDNLFCPLSHKSIDEFSSGKGAELGEYNNPGKMQALHSSSALVVNLFEYWRHRSVATIAKACGASEEMTEMHFEVTHPIPLGRIPPHLDVEFISTQGCKPLAIEAKFTEIYHRHTRRTLAHSYVSKLGLWKGLPGCEAMAHHFIREEGNETSFIYLDAPQLLKHILGLAKAFGPHGFQLLYLWYGVKSLEAERHWEEIVEFESYIKKDGIDFHVMTYQDLFAKILGMEDVSQDYLGYLSKRYFVEKYNSFRDELLALEGKYGALVGDVSRIRSEKKLEER